MNSTEIALLLHKNSEKITRIGEVIGKKISKKDAFENLNEFEKIFIYIDIFENHIKKGGFDAFFWNSAGQFSHEILDAYEQVGAANTAAIIYNSFLLFGEIPIPKDTNTRRAILSKLPPQVWNTLDEKLYHCNDNMKYLVLEFVKKNSAYFD